MGKGKWIPWSGLDEFREQVERMVEEGRAEVCRQNAAGYVWTPPADVFETARAIFIQVELPGVPAQRVIVEIVDGDLVVRGERPCPRCPEQGEPEPVHHLIERAHGCFARRFSLPPGADGQAVTACLAEGVLTITVPKAEARPSGNFSVTVD
ncbi:MAG: Hsp20/alpha crystallin family protein [Desulfovibrio sp.]|jgi:HSP20 family protein